jgi:hypothetical protein
MYFQDTTPLLLLTYLLALLEKLPFAQLLKNFLAFYGTQRFITVFTRALPTGPYSEPDRSNPYHPIQSLQDPF